MTKQEILSVFENTIITENYSKQTVRNYMSALRLFLEYVETLHTDKIEEEHIRDYLYYCKEERNYSYSSIKQVIASIGYSYVKVLNSRATDHRFCNVVGFLHKSYHLKIVRVIKQASEYIC